MIYFVFKIVGFDVEKRAVIKHSKKEVIKHSAAVQISNKISLLQRRCWNLLLANAYDDLPNKEIYEIKIKDLSEALGFDSKNLEYLKNSLEQITSFTLKWNILDKEGKQEWGVASILSEAKIKDGIVSYAYSPTIRKRLYNPTMYAKINLSMQNKFDSKYTLALYELFIDYFIVKIGRGETPYISVENMKALLGIDGTEYNLFKIFNRDVIKKSLKEINKKSDLNVEVVYKREGRSVAFLKFHITEKEDKKDKKFQNEDYLEMFSKLQGRFLLTIKQSETILEKYEDLSLLNILLKDIEKKYKNNEIKNLGAYSFKYLSEHTGIIVSVIDQEAKKEKEDDNEPKSTEIIFFKKLKKEYEHAKEEKVSDFIKNNRDKLDDYFPAFIEENKHILSQTLSEEEIEQGELLKAKINESKQLMMLFRYFLLQNIIDKRYRTFEDYVSPE